MDRLDRFLYPGHWLLLDSEVTPHGVVRIGNLFDYLGIVDFRRYASMDDKQDGLNVWHGRLPELYCSMRMPSLNIARQ
jgi:hypothetical protein